MALASGLISEVCILIVFTQLRWWASRLVTRDDLAACSKAVSVGFTRLVEHYLVWCGGVGVEMS